MPDDFRKPGVRVVLVSRDAAVADPDSDTAARMNAYADRVGHLHVVALARLKERPLRFPGRYTAELVDASSGLWSLWKLFRRVFWSARGHEAGLIVAQDPFETGVVAAAVARLLGVPYVVEDHGAFFANPSYGADAWLDRLRLWFGRRVLRGAAGIRTVSRRAAAAYGHLRPGQKLVTAPVAMRLASEPVPEPAGRFTALYAGRFSKEKNLPLLIEAFSRLKASGVDARLLLVGGGKEEEALRRRVAEAGLEGRVEFRPWASTLDEAFAQAHVAVLASKFEGYGRFAVEALSRGVPVVMTDVGVAGEIVRDGVEGRVVADDAQAFAEALSDLAGDPAKRAVMRQASARRAAEVPDARRIVEMVTTFWHDVGRRFDASSKRRVTIATGIFPPDVGGPATFVPMLAERWTSEGEAVSAVTYSSKDDGEARPYAVHRIARSLPAPLRYLAYAWRAWRVSKRARAVFAQDPVAAGLPAWIAARARGARFVMKIVGDFAWEHAGVQENYLKSIEAFQDDRQLSWRIRFMRAVERFTASRADAVIVPSRYLAGVVRKWGVPEERIRVVYNGVERPEIAERFEKRPFRIVSAGRLVPWKGFDTLIRALPAVRARHPEATLMIIGDGPDEARLKRLAEAEGVADKVNFVGRLSREEVARAIAASGAFALVSSYEGLSHLLVEALTLGTPILTSNAGGNPEVIEDGKSGLVVPVADHGGTALALNTLLTDAGLRARLTSAAAASAARFDVERQIRETTEAVIAPERPRVVVLSRDPMAADAASYVAERLANYAERVEAFHVVVLAKRDALAPTRIRNYTVEVVDARKGPFAIFSLFGRMLSAIPRVRANLVATQDPFEGGLIGVLAARLRGARSVIEDHGAFYVSPTWAGESLLNAFRWLLGMLVARSADAIRVESQYQIDRYRALGVRKPMHYAPLAMKLPDAPQPFRSGPPTFVFAGRFFYEKNVLMLVRAFIRLRRERPGVKLRLIGTGPDAPALEEAIRAAGAQADAEVLPWVHDPDDVYKGADVAVTPTDRECWPRFPLEAMAYGLPVVMTDVGMAGLVIRNGIEGFVTPVRDEEALYRGMKALAEDEGLRRRMREAGLERLKILPSNESLVEGIVAFWNRVVTL